MTGLICRHWNAGLYRKPPFSRLASVPPVLMVHAEHDTATPFAGAQRTLGAMPSAHMIVARGMLGHGVFGMSGTPCVEKGVGRFLLTGQLPDGRSSDCAFAPSPPSRTTRDAGPWPSARGLREELRTRLRRS